MYEGEYTHEGDRCTFEVLLDALRRSVDAALRAVGEVVHDIDCKDDKFGRPETPGIAADHRRDRRSEPDDASAWSREPSCSRVCTEAFAGRER